jgi:hypothetical protein
VVACKSNGCGPPIQFPAVKMEWLACPATADRSARGVRSGGNRRAGTSFGQARGACPHGGVDKLTRCTHFAPS